MTKTKLFDEESEEEVSLKTENEYAKKYDAWREKEELYKLEQKYGPKALNSDESASSGSEDEADELPEVSEEVEKQFLKTLSLLKTKDPRIYDPNYKFFDEKLEKEKDKEPEIKKMTFGDSDDDDDDDDGNIFSIEKKAEVNQSSEIKSSKKESNSKDELKAYLTGTVAHIEEEEELAPLRALWSDPKLNQGEAFLRDYILNKRYLEEGPVDAEQLRDDEELEEDEKRVEEQRQFERAYNFRFEEPDQEFLKRFPRTMNHIRPKDDSRSRKRAEIRERKEREKQRKMEEIARMKSFKLKELKEKIAKIKEVTGNEELAFREEDIEGDFDPEEHDRRMRALFDEQYYGNVDEKKPVFPELDEELEIENWDSYERSQELDNDPGEEAHCEDDDFNMDADFDPKKAKENLLEELTRTMGKKRRNRKKKTKLAQLLEHEKPKFIPEVDKTYSEFMEEYYKMDCEDIIGGDLPTRFKYRQVVPNSFGLTVEEILLADDKELTQWVPLKKIVKYRPENAEKSDVNTYSQKAEDVKLKKKILPSLFKDLPEEPEITVSLEETDRNMKKKKKKKEKGNENESGNNGTNINSITSEIESFETNIDRKEQEKNNKTDNRQKKKKKKAREDKESKLILNNDKDILNQNTNNQEINRSEKGFNKESNKKKKRKNSSNSNICIQNPNNDQITETGNKTTSLIVSETLQNNSSGHSEDREFLQKNHEEPVKNTMKIFDVKTDIQHPERYKRKKKLKSFVVETAMEMPSRSSELNSSNKINLKRKLETQSNQTPTKKKKNKNKAGKNFKQQKCDSSNPLGKLSDERLKAYGLNPKKYRSFLKYKKF